MSEPILIAFGVDAAAAHALTTTLSPVPDCRPQAARRIPGAPADEKFGKLPLSPVEIRNRISCLDRRVDANAHADVGDWPGFLADTIHEISRKFPDDPGLPAWIYGMQIYYEKSHHPEEAQSMRAWLRGSFAKTAQARRTQLQIAGDVRAPAQCYLPDSAFEVPANVAIPPRKP